MKGRLLRFLLVVAILFGGTLLAALLKTTMPVRTIGEFMIAAVTICWIIEGPV